MSKVSIVVRALNEAEHLPALYSGLLRQRRQPDQVILVDSGSTDDTVRDLRAHGAKIVHIDPDEFSFGRALNLGCGHATGDVLVFVSAHVYPIDEHVARAHGRAVRRPDVGLVYGRQTGDDRSRFSELQLLRQWFPDVSDDDQATPFCNNANCAVRAAAWRELPYDETLTGLEDLDWAKRALRRGLAARLRGRARRSPTSTTNRSTTMRNRYRREAIAHRRIFHDQHINLFEAVGLFVLSIGRDYLAARSRRRCLVSQPRIDPRFRAAQYLGTWEGFRASRRRLALAASALLLPKGFSAFAPSQRRAATARAMSHLPSSPSFRCATAASGCRARTTARSTGVPLFHHIVSTLLSVDRISEGGHRHRQPDRQANRSRRAFPTVDVIDRPEHLLGGAHADDRRAAATTRRSVRRSGTCRPTPPTRCCAPSTIEAALDRMEQQAGDHDSLFSVTRLQTRLYDGRRLGAQPRPRRCCSAPRTCRRSTRRTPTSISSRPTQIAEGRRIGDRPILFEIDPLEAVDIDEEPDFVLAEALDRHFASTVRRAR